MRLQSGVQYSCLQFLRGQFRALVRLSFIGSARIVTIQIGRQFNSPDRPRPLLPMDKQAVLLGLMAAPFNDNQDKGENPAEKLKVQDVEKHVPIFKVNERISKSVQLANIYVKSLEHGGRRLHAQTSIIEQFRNEVQGMARVWT